jgi:hypothetical protein
MWTKRTKPTYQECARRGLDSREVEVLKGWRRYTSLYTAIATRLTHLLHVIVFYRKPIIYLYR